MITIYCTSLYYIKDRELLTPVEIFSEIGLLHKIQEDENAVWFVVPHGYCEFRKHFIEGYLDSKGYIVEGVYKTKLCGQIFDFRLIEDINCKLAREK